MMAEKKKRLSVVYGRKELPGAVKKAKRGEIIIYDGRGEALGIDKLPDKTDVPKTDRKLKKALEQTFKRIYKGTNKEMLDNLGKPDVVPARIESKSPQTGDLAARFYRVYANLPLGERKNVCVVLNGEPCSWDVVRMEADHHTVIGTELLEKLAELGLI